MCSKHVEALNKLIVKQSLCIKLVNYQDKCRSKLIVKYTVYGIVHLLVLMVFVVQSTLCGMNNTIQEVCGTVCF